MEKSYGQIFLESQDLCIYSKYSLPGENLALHRKPFYETSVSSIIMLNRYIDWMVVECSTDENVSL